MSGIPVLASGITPPVDWLIRRLGFPKYLDHCTVPRWEAAYNLGTAYCRKIAGSSTWSQHAFGNALDIGIQPDDSPLGDEIKAWLNGPEVTGVLKAHGCSIAHLLWKVPSHHNHIHIDFNPYGAGTPPCDGGPAGKVAQPWPLSNEEENDVGKLTDPTQVAQLEFAFLYDRGVSVGMGIGTAPTNPAYLAAESYKAGLAVGQKLKALP